MEKRGVFLYPYIIKTRSIIIIMLGRLLFRVFHFYVKLLKYGGGIGIQNVLCAAWVIYIYIYLTTKGKKNNHHKTQ